MTDAERPRASVLHDGAAGAGGPVGATEPYDPLRLCTYVTLALLCWLLTPALVVVVFATLGIVAYVRAYRRGLRRSRCKLGDVRLILAFLTAAWIAGAVGVAMRVGALV